MSKATQRLSRRLAGERRRIERRLHRAGSTPHVAGPLLGRANIAYELSERAKGISHGGMGMIAKVVKRAGLTEEIDFALQLLKIHKPYHESDHVLNIAYNALCGGQRGCRSVHGGRPSARHCPWSGPHQARDPQVT